MERQNKGGAEEAGEVLFGVTLPLWELWHVAAPVHCFPGDFCHCTLYNTGQAAPWGLGGGGTECEFMSHFRREAFHALPVSWVFRNLFYVAPRALECQ